MWVFKSQLAAVHISALFLQALEDFSQEAVLWGVVYVCVRDFLGHFSGTEQDALKDLRTWSRRFVNPVQITSASFLSLSLSLYPAPLWNSSSEAITPRWRILDVIASICQLFYSHCEVTLCLPQTSLHDGQLSKTHQSPSQKKTKNKKNVDIQNMVEISLIDNLKKSAILCDSSLFSSLTVYYISKTLKLEMGREMGWWPESPDFQLDWQWPGTDWWPTGKTDLFFHSINAPHLNS